MIINKISNYSMSDGSLVSICIRSIGAVPKERPKLPLDDLDPLKHLIADRRSEKDKQQRTHPITAAYLESHLSESREARRL